MSLNILLFITMHQEIKVPVSMKIMAKTMKVPGLLWSKPPQQTQQNMKSYAQTRVGQSSARVPRPNRIVAKSGKDRKTATCAIPLNSIGSFGQL